jgi:hypothetical protein
MEEIYQVKHRILLTDGHLIARRDQLVIDLKVRREIEGQFMNNYLVNGFDHGEIKDGDAVEDAIFKYGKLYGKHPGSELHYQLTKLDLVPGRFSERVYRPIYNASSMADNFIPSMALEKTKAEILNFPDFFPVDNAHLLSSINQLSLLKDMLLDIFGSVHPEPSNLQVYGQNIKNLLVLSCIEVETHLKGVIRTHESASRRSYSMAEYFALSTILLPDRYEVRFPFFSNLHPISPFISWNAANPTTSLPWYHAYNAIKHNGELEFSKATLENCICAVAAVAVLIRAQYGDRLPFWRERIGSFFDVKDTRAWSISEHILPPWENEQWEAAKLGI